MPEQWYDPVDLRRYLEEMEAAQREYAEWVDVVEGNRIGKPGFFSRYAAGMDGDWKMYFASDAPDFRPVSFGEADRRFDGNWFGPPPDDLPADICLITRDIDHAYVDLFFRDDWMFQAVWSYLSEKGMKPSPYRPA